MDFSPLSFRTANRSEPSSVTIFPVLAVLKLRKCKLLKVRKIQIVETEEIQIVETEETQIDEDV